MSDTLATPAKVIALAELRHDMLAAYRGTAHVNGLPATDEGPISCRLCALPIGEDEQITWENIEQGMITVAHADCVLRAAQQQTKELRELLRRLEWITLPEISEPFCPVCTRPKIIGHVDSCWLTIQLLRGLLA